MCRQVNRWTWHTCEERKTADAGLPYTGANRALKSAEAARQVKGAVAGHSWAKVRFLLLDAGVVLDAARDVGPGAVGLEGRDWKGGTWHCGTLFLPLAHTTVQVLPTYDSLQ